MKPASPARFRCRTPGRHGSFEHGVARAVDLAHAARGDTIDDVVPAVERVQREQELRASGSAARGMVLFEMVASRRCSVVAEPDLPGAGARPERTSRSAQATVSRGACQERTRGEDASDPAGFRRAGFRADRGDRRRGPDRPSGTRVLAPAGQGEGRPGPGAPLGRAGGPDRPGGVRGSSAAPGAGVGQERGAGGWDAPAPRRGGRALTTDSETVAGLALVFAALDWSVSFHVPAPLAGRPAGGDCGSSPTTSAT